MCNNTLKTRLFKREFQATNVSSDLFKPLQMIFVHILDEPELVVVYVTRHRDHGQ